MWGYPTAASMSLAMPQQQQQQFNPPGQHAPSGLNLAAYSAGSSSSPTAQFASYNELLSANSNAATLPRQGCGSLLDQMTLNLAFSPMAYLPQPGAAVAAVAYDDCKLPAAPAAEDSDEESSDELPHIDPTEIKDYHQMIASMSNSEEKDD